MERKLLGNRDIALPKISLGSNDFADWENALKTEWLITNGLGGYASSTVLGINTRKYHGLLLAAFNAPVDRRLLLAKLDEEIQLGGKKYCLGTNESTHGINPKGYQFLTNFAIDPFPTYTYQIAQRFQLNKTTFMPHGKNASITLYEISNKSQEDAEIAIAPLVNSRNFHWVTLKDQIHWRVIQKPSDGGVLIQPTAEYPILKLLTNDGHYVQGQGEWVEMYYRVESSRGESSLDFCFKPGFFQMDLPGNETKRFYLAACAAKNESELDSAFSKIYKDPTAIVHLYEVELKRQKGLLKNFAKLHELIELDDWLNWLILAADTFVVNRESPKSKSVIAGYHWFNDWGRDSLIAVPGLTLVTGRIDDAKQILMTFAHYCREGLVPNSFPDNPADQPAYNTVDATLWFFNAVLQFLKYTNDFQFVADQLWPTMESIVQHHEHGTRFNIRLESDGLIAHGSQLTWMDAAPDSKPVTPREGRAVEVQALWYNALHIMQLLANRFGQKDKAETYRSMAERTRNSFLSRFWNTSRNCLFDVVLDDNNKDDSLRPNQVIAVALDFTILDSARAEAVVNTVWKELHTPYGLRTLARGDSRYIANYGGDRLQRDKAYHNGTVWPWLIGPFTTAFLKSRNHEENWRRFAFQNFLKPLFTAEFYRAGLGSISEIADGDPPHKPNGCIAQAWSVGEPLRAYTEDILLKRPAYEGQVYGHSSLSWPSSF